MFDRRLGMFVHWGIYSVGGWHEQEQMRRGIPRDEYAKYAERFTAERFSADAFVEHLGTSGTSGNIWGWTFGNV
jgi:alpha-L-fucosidase